MRSGDYNAEQEALEDAIPVKEARLEKLKTAANVDAFIHKAKRYTDIDALAPELVRLFIQRIEVGERRKKHPRGVPRASADPRTTRGTLKTERGGGRFPHPPPK